MKHAVFLDRDGTINREADNLRSTKQLYLLPGVQKAIRALNRMKFLVIVVTNQPVVARGWLTEKGVKAIHEVLTRRLVKGGVRIDAIYCCPHHPNANLKKYRKVCSCRKPKPGMILKAMKRFKITPRGSFMIGDHVWDIVAGKAAGLKTIQVKTSSRSTDQKYAHVKPDFVVKNLLDAVRIIKKHGT